MRVLDATLTPQGPFQPTGRMLQHTASKSAAAAWEAGSLGVGFSGTGFLVMYFVGVTSVLRSLGILNSDTPVAGASGGSVAASVSCSGVQHDSFLALASALNSACAGDSCRGNLENVIKAGLTGVLPGDAHQRCSGRLFVSITEATGNNEADVERKISSFPSRSSLIRALMTSTYIPGFAGPSAVTYPDELGVTAAYDGVSTNPLPVPPGVSHVVTVSSQAGSSPPDFTSLVASANSRGADAAAAPYFPLNPTLQPQPSKVDIYPGLSGPLSMSKEVWDSYLLNVPDSGTAQYMYDQGRRDAAAYVRANFGTLSAQVDDTLAATEANVNTIYVPTYIQAVINTAMAAHSDPIGTVANVASTLPNLARIFG